MRLKYVFTVFLVLLAAQTAGAQSNEIKIDILNNFNFGKVAITGWSGSLSIQVANGNFNRVATGSVELKDLGNYSPATIRLSYSGSGNIKVTQIIIPGQITLTRQGGSETRTVYSINCWPAPPFMSLKNNPVTVYLGGTMQLSDYQTNPGGIYTGSLGLTIVYE